MPERIISAERSVIIACDVEPTQYGALIGQTAGVEGIGGYKIGFEVALGIGLATAVRTIRSRNGNKAVIYDHQKAATDIPDTGVNFARAMERGGVDAAIVFPFTGPATQETWIKELQDKEIGVIVGSEMTHPKIRRSEGGYIADDAFAEMFELAVELGVKDFVVPGTKPNKVAEYHSFFEERLGEGNFDLYSPGLITQGGEISAGGRAAGNRWHGIIGRAIFDAEDPSAAAAMYGQQIQRQKVT